MKPKNDTRFHCRIEPELKAELQEYCNRVGGKKTTVVILAIRQFLDRNKTAQDRRY